MTSPEARPSAAGVFVVRDPAVYTSLEKLLAPHRVTAVAAPGSNEVSEALHDRARRAETAAAHAERDLDSTRQQLQDALAKLTEDRDTRGATAPAECAERDLAETRRQLEEAKEEIAKLAARPDGRRPTVSAQRLKDQQAFAALAERMDRAALSQSKSVAAALRESAKGVRCEIAILYGSAERKAS